MKSKIVAIIPIFIKTGEKAGGLNFFKELSSPILSADRDIKNKNGAIRFKRSADKVLDSESNPKANNRIISSEKK